jgi:hypothetical protein
MANSGGPDERIKTMIAYMMLIIIDIMYAVRYIPPALGGGLFWLIERKQVGCRSSRWL